MTMHTRRQILKCLAALPVVGPVFAGLSPTAAAVVPVKEAVIISSPPRSLPFGYTFFEPLGDGWTRIGSFFNPNGLSGLELEWVNKKIAEGATVQWLEKDQNEVMMPNNEWMAPLLSIKRGVAFSEDHCLTDWV